MINLVYGILAAGILVAFVLRRRRERAARVGWMGFSAVMGLYLSEGVLLVLSVGPLDRPAWGVGRTIDARTKARVVDDLRRLGVDAQPNVIPSGLILREGFERDGGRFFPLGGISNVETVFCNETGAWLSYRSDEHGFRNPLGSHRSGDVDVVLLGDSFVHGECVEEGEDIAGRLREKGYRVVNLGMSGNGPLLELGVLTEYAAPLRPSVVVWTIYEGNDAGDLATERQSSTLVRYLDPDFSQSLASRQAQIDGSLRAYVQARLDLQLAADRVEGSGGGVASFLLLRRLEERVVAGFAPRRRFAADTLPFDSLMESTLAEARSRVERWGGELLVLHLPQARSEAGRGGTRGHGAALAEDLGIRVIDASPAIAGHSRPDSLYPFGRRRSAHFGADGYRLIADLLAGHLSAAQHQEPVIASRGCFDPAGRPRHGRLTARAAHRTGGGCAPL